MIFFAIIDASRWNRQMTKFTKLFQRVRNKVKRNYFNVKYNIKCELNVKLYVCACVYMYIRVYTCIYIHTRE